MEDEWRKGRRDGWMERGRTRGMNEQMDGGIGGGKVEEIEGWMGGRKGWLD